MEGVAARTRSILRGGEGTANLPANIVDFRGFDSSVIIIIGGEHLISTGDFPESLSQAMLVGVMLVGIKDHHQLLHGSPVLKNTCVRQVVLDKWLPLIAIGLSDKPAE